MQIAGWLLGLVRRDGVWHHARDARCAARRQRHVKTHFKNQSATEGGQLLSSPFFTFLTQLSVSLWKIAPFYEFVFSVFQFVYNWTFYMSVYSLISSYFSFCHDFLSIFSWLCWLCLSKLYFNLLYDCCFWNLKLFQSYCSFGQIPAHAWILFFQSLDNSVGRCGSEARVGCPLTARSPI